MLFFLLALIFQRAALSLAFFFCTRLHFHNRKEISRTTKNDTAKKLFNFLISPVGEELCDVKVGDKEPWKVSGRHFKYLPWRAQSESSQTTSHPSYLVYLREELFCYYFCALCKTSEESFRSKLIRQEINLSWSTFFPRAVNLATLTYLLFFGGKGGGSFGSLGWIFIR